MNTKSVSLAALAAFAFVTQAVSAQTFPKLQFSAPQKAAINTSGLGVPVAIGDVNNDGNTDLLIRNHLLLGDGTGQFQLSSIDESAVAGPYLQYTALPFRDLNGDGNLDYVRFDPPFDQAGQCPSYPLVITVLLGDGQGHFTTSATYTRPSSTNVSAAFGDYDGDGKTDFAVATTDDVCDSNGNQTVTREITTFLSNGDGTFRIRTHSLPNESGPNSLVAGDFNGDGKTDLAYFSYTYLQGPQVYRIRTELGYGDGTFQEGPVYVLDSEVAQIAAGDLNGDGRTDLVAYLEAKNSPGALPRIASLIAQPNGQFRWLSALAVATLPNLGNYIDRIQTPLIDLNSDGKLDLFVPTLPSSNNQPIAMAAGNGTGNLGTPQRFSVTPNAPTDVMLFPLKPGALPSILYDSNDGQTLYVLKNLSQ
jgi:hypothetical protein